MDKLYIALILSVLITGPLHSAKPIESQEDIQTKHMYSASSQIKQTTKIVIPEATSVPLSKKPIVAETHERLRTLLDNLVKSLLSVKS